MSGAAATCIEGLLVTAIPQLLGGSSDSRAASVAVQCLAAGHNAAAQLATATQLLQQLLPSIQAGHTVVTRRFVKYTASLPAACSQVGVLSRFWLVNCNVLAAENLAPKWSDAACGHQAYTCPELVALVLQTHQELAGHLLQETSRLELTLQAIQLVTPGAISAAASDEAASAMRALLTLAAAPAPQPASPVRAAAASQLSPEMYLLLQPQQAAHAIQVNSSLPALPAVVPRTWPAAADHTPSGLMLTAGIFRACLHSCGHRQQHFEQINFAA